VAAIVLLAYFHINGMAAGVFMVVSVIAVLVIWIAVVVILARRNRDECSFWIVVIEMFLSLVVSILLFLNILKVVMAINA